jgi:outer membrane protein OmpA-like peptidoglycan-associated protein
MKHILIVPFAVGAVLLGGCASTPKHLESLEQARTQVQTLQQDPLATQAASSELAAARKSLEAAETALQNGKAITTVDHYAYLATQQAQTGEARIAEMRAKEQVAQGEAERNRVLLEARTEEADAASAKAEQQTLTADAAREDANAARAEAEDAQRQLAELQAKQTDRGMVLTLSDVLFDTGAATLKPGADLALSRLSAFMEKNPETRLMVEGHTDNVGSETYNEDLSQRRAAAVKAALVSRGIQGDRIEAVGRGESFPVAGNDTQAGRQQNRRVEIIFSNESGAFATDGHAAASR